MTALSYGKIIRPKAKTNLICSMQTVHNDKGVYTYLIPKPYLGWLIKKHAEHDVSWLSRVNSSSRLTELENGETQPPLWQPRLLLEDSLPSIGSGFKRSDGEELWWHPQLLQFVVVSGKTDITVTIIMITIVSGNTMTVVKTMTIIISGMTRAWTCGEGRI